LNNLDFRYKVHTISPSLQFHILIFTYTFPTSLPQSFYHPQTTSTMQFTTTLALLIAAVGINAAPTAELTKRLDSIPLSIYGGSGCNSGTGLTTAYINTDGLCQGISPIFSGNTDSGVILPANLASLPKGCSGKFKPMGDKGNGKRIGGLTMVI
jgi:hypothetical protein